MSQSKEEPSAAERATWKIPEAARVAGVGRSSFYLAIKEGRIPHIKWGRRIVIPKKAFEKWLDSCGEAK